jgi:hypothetical protein
MSSSRLSTNQRYQKLRDIKTRINDRSTIATATTETHDGCLSNTTTNKDAYFLMSNVIGCFNTNPTFLSHKAPGFFQHPVDNLSRDISLFQGIGSTSIVSIEIVTDHGHEMKVSHVIPKWLSLAQQDIFVRRYANSAMRYYPIDCIPPWCFGT